MKRDHKQHSGKTHQLTEEDFRSDEKIAKMKRQSHRRMRREERQTLRNMSCYR